MNQIRVNHLKFISKDPKKEIFLIERKYQGLPYQFKAPSNTGIFIFRKKKKKI